MSYLSGGIFNRNRRSARCEHYSNGSVVTVVLPSLRGRLIRFFQSLLKRESAVREYLPEGDRSVEKNLPWAAPTRLRMGCGAILR